MPKAIIQFTQEFVDAYADRIEGTIPREPVTVELSGTSVLPFCSFIINTHLDIQHPHTGSGIHQKTIRGVVYFEILMQK